MKPKNPRRRPDAVPKTKAAGPKTRRASAGAPKPAPPTAPASLRVRLVTWALGAAGVLVLPFVVLIRGALWLDQSGVNPWIALGASVVATAAVLFAYLLVITWRVTGRLQPAAWMRHAALSAALAYTAYGSVYLAVSNAKSDTIRASYHALHPVLRVAASTLILFDGEAVLTDLARTPTDYARMHLPVQERSLHYPQADGYVHALDLRTVGRPWWRNWLAEGYFRAMGFETERHVGTADHLHVMLP